MAKKNISLRMEEETLFKLHVIADYEGRSANGQLVYMVNHLIERFEKQHGEIEYRKPKKKETGTAE